MKLLILLPFLLLSFCQQLLAATFIPISYEEQIKNSDAVVHATFRGKTYKKVGDDEVVTVNSFRLKGSSGITHSGLINKNDFKVISPGGVWNGRTYSFSGSSKFEKGEEVLLFLKKNSYGFRVMNLSLGKYEVESEGKTKFLKNAVFPSHPRMKPIKLSELQEKLNLLGKEEIKNLDQRHSYKNGNNNNGPRDGGKRTPASIGQDEKGEGEDDASLSLYALFAILALGGLLFRYVSKKFT